MPLTKVLQNIKEQIDNKELKKNKNESDLKQDIWDILKELSWPNKNSKNEYKLSTGDRPDFALIHPDSQEPLVFIELKRHGLTRLKNSKEQVKGYYSNSTVPLIVLTDVETWMFYYKGKLAFETDFSSSSVRKVSGQLKEFLEQDRVYKGDAYRFAEGKLAEKNNLAKARKKIPAAWKEIIEESNLSLNNLIKELQKKAGAGLGVQPSYGDIVAFLRSLKEPVFKSREQDSSTLTPRDNGSKGEKRKGEKEPWSGRSGELVISGESFHYKNPTDAMVTVFKELERRERGFYQRFYNDRRNHGRMRRIIAQGAMRLYDSDNPRYAKAYKQLGGGWVIGTKYNKQTIEKNIRIAAEVARLRFGKDIIVNFDDSLQRQERQVSAPPPSGASERKQPVQRRVRRVSAPGPARVKVVIDGKPSSWQDQSDAMATVFKKLQKRDRSFCQQFYEQPRNHGRTRRIIAQDARELYDNSDNPHLKKAYRQLGGGWFISTSHSWPRKKEIIQLAADVAGFNFKEDISEKGIIVNLDT